MEWNEVTRFETKGNILAVKDAMIMLSKEEESPDWPFVICDQGEYIFEINVPVPFYAHRARIRKIDSEPTLGKEIGSVEIDHSFVGIIDYEEFRDSVKKDYEEYDDWTVMELDEELSMNFSGEIAFENTKLLYVKSGDGDGIYKCYELIQNGVQVGIECVFIN